MNKELFYDLEIESQISFWGGGLGVGYYSTTVSNEIFEYIKKDPLLDYAQFGVSSVNYVRIKSYKKEKIKLEGKMVTISYDEPEYIEAGKFLGEANDDDDDFIEYQHINLNYLSKSGIKAA